MSAVPGSPARARPAEREGERQAKTVDTKKTGFSATARGGGRDAKEGAPLVALARGAGGLVQATTGAEHGC